MGWRRHAGGIAGGTLGYIAGNIPGAYHGYQIGKYLGTRSEMAPIPRKRKRSDTVTGGGGKRARYSSNPERPTRISRRRRGFRVRRYRKRSRGGAHVPRDDAASTSVTYRGRKRNVKMFKGFKKLFGARTVNSSMGTRVTALAQNQGVSDIRMFYNGVTHTNGIGTSFDVREMMKNLQYDEYNPVGINTKMWKTRKFFISKIKVVSRIRNSTTAPVNVILYDIVARRDTNTINDLAATPSAAWIEGMTQTTAIVSTGGLANGVTRPGATPFMSPTFTKFYKVRKVNEFTLHAGATHKHYITMYPNKLWSYEELEVPSDPVAEYGIIGNVSGISAFCMVVLKGGVSHGTTGDAANDGIYSKAALDIVTDYRATGWALEKNRKVSTYYQLGHADPGTVTQVVEDTDVVAEVAT